MAKFLSSCFQIFDHKPNFGISVAFANCRADFVDHASLLLFEVFRNNFRLYFSYICLMTKNEIISHINLSFSNLNVIKVILFGSYAKGTQSADSDIDLLVVTNDDFVFESFAEKMKVKTQIANALNPLRKYVDIDLIVHTKPMFDKFIELDSGFKREILSSGSVIYEANN
ncbi:MAG TPA: hypothetical protein DHV48_05830 [Prolixibacteraceae bacterium]|nr:hypothetical protein [Prolixibacteraceae bacterium]